MAGSSTGGFRRSSEPAVVPAPGAAGRAGSRGAEPLYYTRALCFHPAHYGRRDDKDVDTLIDEVIDREGGYSNRKADRGGATCWGITEAVARAAGYAGEMRGLPRARAVAIYRRRYWIAPGFDRVAARAPRIAAELFDTGVNMGAAVATGFLQRALNALNRGASHYPDLPLDGRIGPATLAALDAFLAGRASGGETVLLKALEALQGERYVRLAEQRPADEAFLYGWLANRIGA